MRNLRESTPFSISILFDIDQFQHDLIKWYNEIKRDLPWRENKDPYRIWVSEIMLQQTQVDTVIPYFTQFMERYPTIFHLAEADEQDVLKAWEGLGYYSRARNLHTAVKEVVEKYDGQVPEHKDELKTLKGIGPYTLGAIMSIAFDKPEPAIDGNVMRVISRILLIEEDITKSKTKRLFDDVLRELISKKDPSSFNQGLMELGALICHPKKPKCHECPLKNYCQAYELNRQEELPVKTKAKKQKQTSYYSLILKDAQNRFFIQKRPEDGLLANLWEFPLVMPSEMTKEDIINWLYLEYGRKVKIVKEGRRVRHIFSHVIWEIDPIICHVDQSDPTNDGKFVTLKEMAKYPMPNVMLKIKEQLK